MPSYLMDRKIFATVTAVLRFPAGVTRLAVDEEGLDASFTASRKHGADFEDAQVSVEFRKGSNIADLKGELIIRADDDVGFEELMAGCEAIFKVGDIVIPSELTGWTVNDSK